ncbi:MAG: SMI1/KNR4 family protein [Bryobacterales bacterium]|nr:SMI1/KNR4 family protein [Bryobacterales bacterium]
MPSTREIIQAALEQNLIDEDGNPVQARLLPGLTRDEVDAFGRSLPVPPSEDVRGLLAYCSGIEGTLEQIDFTGRSLRDSLGPDFLMPCGFPIARDGFGNFWAVDLQPGSIDWGPIYYCCHDAPVMLLQAATIQEFVIEVFKMYTPPHKSLVEDVHEDRLFEVWRRNPGVIPHASALASPDPDIQTFALDLDPSFELIDLRNAQVGMGFSWGRYGPYTEVKRFVTRPIFAYRRPEKKGLLSRLIAR